MSTGDSQHKGSDVYIWAGLSTDTKPSKAFVGNKLVETDTGLIFEWSGISWYARQDGVEIDMLVKSVPTTDTFHHLGHEGKVFIHSDRHSGIANGANFDILIRIPAGNANRQIHMRFNYIGKANTGTLDIDVILYEGITVSADGAPEDLISTNDAIVKSTGVTMFSGPTVTDLGNPKAWTMMAGEKKSASSKEQTVPEYILAPNGTSARDYLMRATNNSGGTVDIVNALFFYDSEAT